MQLMDLPILNSYTCIQILFHKNFYSMHKSNEWISGIEQGVAERKRVRERNRVGRVGRPRE